MCRSLRNEFADPDPQKERPDPIRPKGKKPLKGTNPQNRIHESESHLLIPRNHDSDSESLIPIHNLRRVFVSFSNERYIIWGHGCR
ncbi:hypothetical protein AVEN_167308-1 [Araneus ventricosus]|uniref:Uncharacterized protein n=1 Tax=Araneus ventricosus TaxID=182803 RepID=A0A4Y2DED1_ARAVE|nr:hypothetical protein AVEN_167308-1 [Araneus ventricosus]